MMKVTLKPQRGVIFVAEDKPTKNPSAVGAEYGSRGESETGDRKTGNGKLR